MHDNPVLKEWAHKRGIEHLPRMRDGRIAFNVDERYRVYLYPAPENRLLIEARICDLPAAADARERLMHEALQAATGRMREQNARLTVDAADTQLLLQADTTLDAGVAALDDALGAFLNHLAVWRTQLQPSKP